MKRGQYVLVACVIEAGAFSGERVFRFKLADETTDYSGVAPFRYCFDENQNPLTRDQPPRGQSIEGYIEAFLVANGGEQATVELPDGEALKIKTSQIPFRQDQNQGKQYVPIRP